MSGRAYKRFAIGKIVELNPDALTSESDGVSGNST